MDVKPILISDLGGVLYSFNSGFDAVKHTTIFNAVIERYVRGGDTRHKLDIEQEAVISGALPIHIVVQAVRNMYENSKKYKLVFVSNSRVPTSRRIIDTALRVIDIPKQEINRIMEQSDLYDMSEYGTKKDSAAWKRIFEKYPTIDAIIEDSQENLDAAYRAAQELGYTPRKSLYMIIL